MSIWQKRHVICSEDMEWIPAFQMETCRGSEYYNPTTNILNGGWKQRQPLLKGNLSALELWMEIIFVHLRSCTSIARLWNDFVKGSLVEKLLSDRALSLTARPLTLKLPSQRTFLRGECTAGQSQASGLASCVSMKQGGRAWAEETCTKRKNMFTYHMIWETTLDESHWHMCSFDGMHCWSEPPHVIHPVGHST